MEVVPMTKIEIQTLYEVMFTDYPDIVNVAQVQAMLGISRHLAYALIGDGDIPGMKIGNAYRVPKINVIRYALSAGNPRRSRDLNLYGTLDGHSRRAYNKNGPKGCPFMCYPQRR